MIILGDFTLFLGRDSFWKVDCDLLSDECIGNIAGIIANSIPSFYEVREVPNGGDRLAKALRYYVRHVTQGNLLFVDDVLTTGYNMEKAGERYMKDKIQGVVLFARGPCPHWVWPVFQVGEWVND